MVVNGDIPGSEAHRDLAIMPVDFSTVGTAQMTLMGQGYTSSLVEFTLRTRLYEQFS